MQQGGRILELLVEQLDETDRRIEQVDAEIRAWHRANPVSQRLAKIPGVGPLIATAIVATVADASSFRSGRQFAASLGLTPLQNCSGGKERMGRISRMGDRYLRRLLVVGMTSLVRRARAKPDAVDPRFTPCFSASRRASSQSRRRTAPRV